MQKIRKIYPVDTAAKLFPPTARPTNTSVFRLSVLLKDTEAITSILTPLSAISLLVFCLLYTPCVAAVASIKRELGGKWAMFVVIGQCLIAWICAFIVRMIGMAIGFA